MTTDDSNFPQLELQVFADSNAKTASGKIYLPEGEKIENISVKKHGKDFQLDGNPLKGKTSFKIETAGR